MFINQCYDELNVRAPDLVRDVHRAYVKAGAEVLETNSFGANRLKLAQYGLEAQVRELNRARGAARARGGRRRDVLVAGAVGPLGVRLEPYGPTSARRGARDLPRADGRRCARAAPTASSSRRSATSHEIEQAIAAARERRPGDAGRSRR